MSQGDPKDFTTRPGGLDEYRERKHAPPSVQAVADSVWLKLLQYVVSVVGLPVAVWALNTFATQLADINVSIQSFRTAAATTELRIQALERDATRNGAAIDAQKATLADHEYRTRRLEELTPHARVPASR